MNPSLKKLNLWPVFGVALTLLAIGVYELLPQRKHSLIKAESWHWYKFGSNAVNQPAVNHWLNEGKTHLRCSFTDTDLEQLCGINFFYGYEPGVGVDLSKFSALKFNTRFKGKAPKVRIFLRNHNPEFSVLDDANSAKFISIVLLTEELARSEPVTIALRELVVADWWLEQRELARKHQSTSFNNVVAFGVDFSLYAQGADELDFEVGDIWFEGALVEKEHWYLGILGFWGVFILAYVLLQYISLLRNSRAYSKVITELITDKVQLEQESHELKKLSSRDRLTGALNRHGIEQNITTMVASQRGKMMGLILMDVDHFKRVNDQRGHDVGDQVLKEVAAIATNNIREHDVLGRWGGEEFLLLTPGTDTTAAYRIAEKIRRLIASHTFGEDSPFVVTASFGVTSVQVEDDFDAAFKRADIALYKAKAQGRNCSIIADE